MTLSELRDRYKDTIPFVEAEITDDMLRSVFRECVNFYNKFNLDTKIEYFISDGGVYTFIPPAPDMLFRVYYTSLTYENRAENLFLDWVYTKPAITIVAGNWTVVTGYNITLDTVDLDLHDLLDQFVKNSLIIALSNKRRLGIIPDFPIDGKGDQFYGEAKGEVDRLRGEIQMLAPITF